jgi:ATP-dependent DNA helicase HFM1/MER3
MKLKDKKLSNVLQHGIAFHNAGLHYQDRQLVESLFSQSDLRVICTTSTLAVGINLPAHLVIIKSTHMYADGHVSDYSDLGNLFSLDIVPPILKLLP